jgi:hypothetical protein
MALFVPIKAPEGIPEYLIFKPPTSGIYKVSNTSLDEVSRKVESPDYTGQFLFDRSRFIPQIDYSNPG